MQQRTLYPMLDQRVCSLVEVFMLKLFAAGLATKILLACSFYTVFYDFWTAAMSALNFDLDFAHLSKLCLIALFFTISYILQLYHFLTIDLCISFPSAFT
jgi:hypothetical protein